jgi:hypothetical protein
MVCFFEGNSDRHEETLTVSTLLPTQGMSLIEQKRSVPASAQSLLVLPAADFNTLHSKG